MRSQVRQALRQPALAWLLFFLGASASSWPLLDLAVGDCRSSSASIDVALDCQIAGLTYFFAVWAALIGALIAIALAGDAHERKKRAKQHD